jgi:predicted small secreted protein
MSRLIEGFVVVALVYLLAGCCTLSGIGRDIQWLGDLEPAQQQTVQR